ncbi:S8 family serine peptidase [Actinomadura sp. 9N407]|uniref:S8 family serine peptidase n=1 Tax=Actinomadura sp. 9N407 TaxID=3375154 RepID=UPI00379D8CC3
MLRTARLIAAIALALLLAPPAPARADQVRNTMSPVLESINVPRAWTLSRGSGVTVAVLDSGVDPEQADLTGSVTEGPDYTVGANPPGVAPKRLHGTNMASIIAGHGHGFGGRDGLMGVAPEARVLALRVILERDERGFDAFNGEERYEGTIAKGVRYAADHGADVINLSLGRSYPTKAERAAVAYAIGRNVVVVAAAGNGGESRERNRRPAYSYPASFPGVISVAAVDAQGAHAGFSNRNPAVVVSAPGVRILGAGPGGGYWVGDGTSPATAFVSGVAALVRSRHRGLAPALVTQAIVASTQARPARGYDLGVGFGRVDAHGALAEADRLAGARVRDLGLSPRERFGDESGGEQARPVTVVYRNRWLLGACVVLCVLAASGLATVILMRRDASWIWQRAPDS